MRDKTNILGIPTRSDTNLTVQSQKQDRSTVHAAKTKALISCAVTAQLICGFVFAYANCWFSHALAHISATPSKVNKCQHSKDVLKDASSASVTH